MKSRSFVTAVLVILVSLNLVQTLWAAVVSGTVESVVADKKKIILKPSGDKPKQVFSVPDGVTITLDGKTAKLDELKEGQQLTVFTSSSGAVTKLIVRAAKASSETSSTPTEPPAAKAKKTKPSSSKADDVTSDNDGGDSPQFRGP